MTNLLGLYIHIPFCTQKCSYCDFYSLPGADKSLMDRYLKALTAHMAESAVYTGKKAGNGSLTVDTVYFGGGTPTVFGEKRLKSVMDTVKKNWELAKNPEITIEANPESAGDPKLLKSLRRIGFNRISVGVQSTNPKELEVLGRRHNAEQAADCVREARNAGFENISVDLMYGIPGQGTESLEETLKAVRTWNVSHVSLYGLKLEKGTPLCENRLDFSFPDDDAQADLYLFGVDFLEREGFAQYEISNFAAHGRTCRHNLKYWNLDPYLGFGPAAHSDFGKQRYGHIRSLEGYIEGIANGDAVVAEMNVIDPLERSGEYIMCGLRTVRGISGGEYASRYRVSMDPIETRLKHFASHGLAMQENGRWRLTPKGFLVSNRIIGTLLENI